MAWVWDLALGQIEKQFGKGSIMRLGENNHLEIEGITTGSMALDVALGGKGIPRGRVVEVFGPEGSGKTTRCLTVIANVQKNGGQVHWARDAEEARRAILDICQNANAKTVTYAFMRTVTIV